MTGIARNEREDVVKIWVDADACPAAIKEVIVRGAERLAVPAVFVANKHVGLPRSTCATAVRVAAGPEVVDDYIARHAEASDLVVTQDIPLASVLVSKGVTVLSPRGELHTEGNIGERLSIRNFMHDAREAGVITPGPHSFGQKEKQRFSNTFDRELTRCSKQAGE